MNIDPSSSVHGIALQYPLIFPYGERAFQVDVLYNGISSRNAGEKYKNAHVNARLLLSPIPF
jgi:hypothetical protein